MIWIRFYELQAIYRENIEITFRSGIWTELDTDAIRATYFYYLKYVCIVNVELESIHDFLTWVIHLMALVY